MPSTTPQGRDKSFALAAKVDLLCAPDTFPERPQRIEAAETHMSWVFLTDRYTYKMKKPVRYDFLDLSTLALRQRNCEEEVRLNRRLAADVYLGTVPLVLDADGAAHLGGEGEVIEWLVKMRRLPAERMLDHMIRQHHIAEADLDSLAALLVRFYRTCAPVMISADEYRDEFRSAIELNRRELSVPEHELPCELIDTVQAVQLAFLDREAAQLDARVAAGKIVEGHGDLRPEHICLEPQPVIIDCLEFNRRFRIVDPVDELAFLAMECERLGAPFVGARLLRRYEEFTRDQPPARLVHFYKSFRAALRARFAIGHARELQRQDWPKWQRSATDYLHRAAEYGAQLDGRRA